MATYTQLINKVLRRLREATVAAPSDTDYSLLIGEFVNDAKRDVEEAWQWNALRTVKTVTTADATSTYSITDSTKRGRLLYPKETPRKRNVYDNTSKGWLAQGDRTWMDENLLLSSDTGQPTWYDIYGLDANEDLQIRFYLTPNGVYDIKVHLIVPQDDFTSGTEVLTVPEQPVVLGAYARAIAERGEDNGRTHGEAEQRFLQSLNSAIAYDAGFATGEDMWTVE